MNELAKFDGTIVAVIVVMAVLGAIFGIWFFRRAKSVLTQWAKENGFTILRYELRNFLRGPFLLTTSDGQTVYYVTVRDQYGQERSGWVCCGGFWAGMMGAKAKVRWEQNGAPPLNPRREPRMDTEFR